MSDPIRWRDGGGPPHADSVLDSIEPAPALSPDTRANVREQLRHATALPMSPRLALRAPVAGAVAVMLGGLLLWTFRPHDAGPAATLRPEVGLLVDEVAPPSAEDAGVAEASPAAAPDAGIGPVETTPATESVGAPERAAPAHEPAATQLSPRERPRRRRAPEAREDARPDDEDHRPAHLVINTMPWAAVWVDGVFIGNTPIRDYSLPAGSHVLRFRLGGGDDERTVHVDLEAGQTTRMVRRW